MKDWTQVLDFWFGPPQAAEFGRPRKCWFEKSAAFDAEVRVQFELTLAAAERGDADSWREAPLAALALVIVLDQFSRNIYRGTPRAFASDAHALAIASDIIRRGFDHALLPVQKVFAYLPFEHSEDLAMQRRSLELFAPLAADASTADYVDYAQRHYEVIARLGRFPHRNAILGRASTPAELAVLAQAGASF